MARVTATPRVFAGDQLARVAFPMGGMGAGMICLDGAGSFSHVSLRHRPDVFHEPWLFAALSYRAGAQRGARVLEGPVPSWKVMFPWGRDFSGSGGGGGDRLFGLPRFRHASFTSRFPFGSVALSDADVPVVATVTGWSPFVPGDSDSASLPVAGVEYSLVNTSRQPAQLVFSYHARNFIYVKDAPGKSGVAALADGYELWQRPGDGPAWNEGSLRIRVDSRKAGVDNQWFRGGWFDNKTMLWTRIAAGKAVDARDDGNGEGREGASVYVPVHLKPGEERTVRVRLCWYVPCSNVCAGYSKEQQDDPQQPRYRPWYASRFSSLEALDRHWEEQYEPLRRSSASFSECFFDSTLPAEVTEAVAANLTILKSPTVLRQHDGRLWAWEGCCDGWGCCHGSCTHVWNYAQALPHLFPDLERSLRETEFNENQDERGHQNFRARLPIAPVDHGFHAAADGQLGGILKVYREWRISGDTEWLRGLWPKVRRSLDYCIETWDPRHVGALEEPHHNTYDIEFWGPDGMCTSFYLGALRAARLMAEALGEPVTRYDELLDKGRAYLDKKLYNGEYYAQRVVWTGLRAADPVQEAARGLQQNYSEEALALLRKEGPKYQYGTGCLSDGVLGEWMAEVCGVGSVMDARRVKAHLNAVYKHNFKTELSSHANPQRPTYALNDEAGLLLCSWPRGGALSLPFPYSNEVWTGIEYQVAAHLMMHGAVDKALDIVRAVRSRYDGRTRNPFNEYECGHWYGRALSSYAMLQGMTGIRYDAVERTLYARANKGNTTRCFLCTASGYGTVAVSGGRVSLKVVSGTIDVARIVVNGKEQRAAASTRRRKGTRR
jgi:uncharacterized protein (DUF608 family)